MVEGADFINPDPVITPDQPGKTFDKLWMSRCIIETPEYGTALVITEFLPYDGDTILTDGKTLVKNITNLWELIQTDPQIADAYDKFILAIKKATGL